MPDPGLETCLFQISWGLPQSSPGELWMDPSCRGLNYPTSPRGSSKEKTSHVSQKKGVLWASSPLTCITHMAVQLSAIISNTQRPGCHFDMIYKTEQNHNFNARGHLDQLSFNPTDNINISFSSEEIYRSNPNWILVTHLVTEIICNG